MIAPGGLLRHIRLRSATALVVANIIGAGIFTTTGFQAADLGHPGYILALWLLGGILALCGALCYAELGSAMPEAGAEYVYLRETYGPMLGFMSAFVSLIAGFSAPIAAALKGLTRYAAHFFPASANIELIPGLLRLDDTVAIALVWLLVAVHLRGTSGGVSFNDAITLFKVTGIVAIILAAAVIGNGEYSNLTRVAPWYEELSPASRMEAFATSLIFVMFCYSGWNAAAYVAAEIDDPQRNLPRALLVGTALVVVLYLGLNAVFFYGAGVEALAGEVEVGLVAARQLFGPWGVSLVTMVLCVSIFASASAMTIAGPRVYYAFGRDFHPLSSLSATNIFGAPKHALMLQGARYIHRNRVRTRRSDSAIRRLHVDALRKPCRFLCDGAAGSPAPHAATVPRLGLSLHACAFPGRSRLDDGLGVSRPAARVRARAAHSIGWRGRVSPCSRSIHAGSNRRIQPNPDSGSTFALPLSESSRYYNGMRLVANASTFSCRTLTPRPSPVKAEAVLMGPTLITGSAMSSSNRIVP